jgi:hypothetical protein
MPSFPPPHIFSNSQMTRNEKEKETVQDEQRDNDQQTEKWLGARLKKEHATSRVHEMRLVLIFCGLLMPCPRV